MKQNCPNHDEFVSVLAKGLCAACYMRQRRKANASYVGRAPTGTNYKFAMQHRDQWIDAYHDRIIQDHPDGCHEWIGGTTKGGYGVMHLANKTLLAHRLAFTLAGGDPSTPVVMHTCDNPACVNPEHLRGGSYKQNMADMDAKSRRNIGKAGEHLKDRKAHPRAVAVVTPFGEFASAALAAEKSPLTARTIQRYCQKQLNGYKYA